ncbi:MAG TPA: alpha/beta hydrolase [Dehalococcoidia bacterium]|nr:alpha/beta hydrolase [Dehalococcoidia bacterium]
MPKVTVGGRQFFHQLDDFTDPWDPGEVVVFHHGYSRNHKFWYEWVPLIGRRYRCLRFDMRGHGQSDPLPDGYEPTLDNLAADTIRLLDALGIDRVHFVGESLAGVIGIWLGAHYPDRLRSLLLLSTPVKVSEQGRSDFSAGMGSWEAAFDKLSPAEWARETMGHRFDPAVTAPEYIEWAVAENAKTPVESLRKYARLIEHIDMSGGIPPVTVPTLLIAGGSKLAPPAQARFLQQQIPGSRLELIPDARHLVGYSHPAECARLALEFWGAPTR